MAFLFEKLAVYRESVEFARDVGNLVSRWSWRERFLIDQFTRASMSIPMNLAEGNGRSTHRDRRRFFHMARGSLHECIPLLDVARGRDLLRQAEHQSLRQRAERIALLLNGLIAREERA